MAPSRNLHLNACSVETFLRIPLIVDTWYLTFDLGEHNTWGVFGDATPP